jgi:UDP-N-acetylmuramate dehydrogenase
MSISLKDKHTFGCEVAAKEYWELASVSEAIGALKQWSNVPYLILGGGSNVLFTQPEIPRVLAVRILGVELLNETKSFVEIEVGAGVPWHPLVLQTLQSGWFGLENLALIPGLTGAGPMQNIGAYGVELQQFCIGVNVIQRQGFKSLYLDAASCDFAYRSSIFKTRAKDEFLISSVRFRLPKAGHHQPNTDYGAIRETLLLNKIDPDKATPVQVAEAVMHIRSSKLPNPKELGNAGSFFKNPIVSIEKVESLLTTFPQMPVYPASDGWAKLAAGWLIDQAGWKGRTLGSVGMHKHQALVLVNYGDATGTQLWSFAQRVAQDVFHKFGVKLEPEVNLWPPLV